MAVEHVDIVDPDIHEPKGVASADQNHVYTADGSGSGDWLHPSAHGGFYYSNIGTGTTITTPTSYTLVGPTTTVTHAHEFSHNSLGRLTYSGTPDRHVFINCNLSVKHSTGSGQDLYFAVFKNGVLETGSEVVRSADSANFGAVTVQWDAVTSTGDYFEIYCKVSSGNIIVHSIYLNANGVLD